jgi:hypothetical protein
VSFLKHTQFQASDSFADVTVLAIRGNLNCNAEPFIGIHELTSEILTTGSIMYATNMKRVNFYT